ncbi:DUF488 domain-containing protein [Metabacillus arenae]|uniref:DUF488 domain-containing protein n=1 Tax=Metabacillus arenae TaxID=2771434 RepID=A0A926RYS2_9BACI|nr:DUF488 domain-containing protein [Metabacillus arenae]MBD1382381.1 DUF488 domain-containing protein [Metabacillus arenae]
MHIHLKRIYEDPSSHDGKRILVDRVWPRGISKEKADLDEWMKEIAPTGELRKWFNHEPDRFERFTEKYKEEIENDSTKADKLKQLTALAKKEKVTILYGAKDEKHNHAVVLKKIIENGLH